MVILIDCIDSNAEPTQSLPLAVPAALACSVSVPFFGGNGNVPDSATPEHGCRRHRHRGATAIATFSALAPLRSIPYSLLAPLRIIIYQRIRWSHSVHAGDSDDGASELGVGE